MGGWGSHDRALLRDVAATDRLAQAGALGDRRDRTRLSLTRLADGADRALITLSRLAGAWQSNMTRAEYGDKFARIRAYLAAGRLLPEST